MEITYGESNLIDARAPLSEVHHDSTLTGKGTKTNRLKANIHFSGEFGGDGTPNNPVQLVPAGVITDESGNPLMTENNEFIVPEDWYPSVTGGIYWTGNLEDFAIMADDNELIPGAKYLVTDPYSAFWVNTHRLLYTALTTFSVEEEAYGLFADPDHGSTGDYTDTPVQFNANLGVWYSGISIPDDGYVVVYDNKHYMVTTFANLDGNNPVDNSAAYTELPPNNENRYGYKYVWNKCWVDKNPSNAILQGRMDGRGNYVHNIGGYNGIDPVAQFQWGYGGCYNNTLINSIFSNMCNVHAAEISGLKLNNATIFDITSIGEGNYLQNISMESGSTISTISLHENCELVDTTLRQNTTINSVIIDADATVHNIHLDAGASLNNITLGVSSTLTNIYLAPGIVLANKTITGGDSMSNQSFFFSNTFTGTCTGMELTKVFDTQHVMDYTSFTADQTGTDDPVISNLVSFTFNGSTISRVDVGYYNIELTTPMLFLDTLILVETSNQTPGFICILRDDDSNISINTYDVTGTLSDDILRNATIKISILND